jgi:hypothetical protein
MKTINKKAILAMLVAVIMSLGVMSGIDSMKEVSDMNLIWGVGSALATSSAGVESSITGSIMLNCYGALISAGSGALYGSLFGPGIGTAVGFGVGL